MSFTLTRFVVRMLKKDRDFAFVDKIGVLTNTFITSIPNTELQRNGQYGALIVTNNTYNFESQITQAEYNLSMNINKEIGSSDFNTYFDTILDVTQKVITTLKQATNAPHELKSMICLMEGNASSDKSDKVTALIKTLTNNNFIGKDSSIKQVSYIWNKTDLECYLNISQEPENNKIIFALQDFKKDDLNFSNARTIIDTCLREFKTKVINEINA